MRRTIPTLALALMSVNIAAFAAGPAQANPQVCVEFPNPDCQEGSWASVDYSQNPGLEVCVNTLVDSTPFFCPTYSQRPCPPEGDVIGASGSREGALFGSSYHAYSFPQATTGETVTIARPGPLTTPVLVRFLREAADGQCEDLVDGAGEDGWVSLDHGMTVTLSTFAPYDPARTVSNTYRLEILSLGNEEEPVTYHVRRDGPSFT